MWWRYSYANGSESMKVLDLFSGFGGWSRAFVKHGCDVIRIENNPMLEHIPFTQCRDVLEVRDYLQSCYNRGLPIQSPDVILASPPCLHFSNAFSAPKSMFLRKFGTLDGYEPPMELLEATLEIIEMARPRYWVIENVVGSIKYFEKYLGKPRQIIGPYVLWGNFPLIALEGEIPTKAEKDKRHDPLRSNYKAEIPAPISMGLLAGILEQKTIDDYL